MLGGGSRGADARVAMRVAPFSFPGIPLWHILWRFVMTAFDFENLDLDALRAEANNKYKNLVVSGVEFRGLIRMSKDERAEYQRLLAARNEADEGMSDIVDFYRAILLLTAADKVAAESLLNDIGDDAAVLDTLVTAYFEYTQVGEA